MKRLMLLMALLVSPVCADQVSQSSFTATNESAYIAARNLSRVMVGATSSGGVIKVYNSTFTTVGLISSMTLTAANFMDFDNLNVKGIYYVTTGNSAGVTIIYKK